MSFLMQFFFIESITGEMSWGFLQREEIDMLLPIGVVFPDLFFL